MKSIEIDSLALDDCWNRIGVSSPNGASCPKLEQVTHCRNCEVYSAAGRRILDRRPPDGYRQEWTKIYAAEKPAQDKNLQTILLFRLGDDWLSLPSHLVEEITVVKAIHSLPHSDYGMVRGLVNIRGELRVCVSLGNMLGLQQGEVTADDLGYDVFARMVVISNDKDQFVFPVTEVFGTHRYARHELQSIPATISKAKGTYTRNILKWKGHDVACLDDELLMYTLKKDLT